MAFTAIELGHEYLVLTDHSPRLTVANGLSVARLTKQLEVVEAVNEHLGRRLPAAQGHRGRHPRRRRRSTRPTRCSPGSTYGWPRCTPSSRMDKAPMTRRMVGGGRATRSPTCSGTAPAGWSPAAGAPGRQSEFDAEGGVRGLRRDTTPRWRSTPAPSAATRRASCSSWRIDIGLPVLDRLRRPRARAARLPGLRLRPRRGARHRPRPDRQHLADGAAPGMVQPGYCASLTPPRRVWQDGQIGNHPQPRLSSPHAVHRVVHRRWTRRHVSYGCAGPPHVDRV